MVSATCAQVLYKIDVCTLSKRIAKAAYQVRPQKFSGPPTFAINSDIIHCMKPNDTTFKEMISRIASGELTRKQAAQTYDLDIGTLNSWISRHNLSDSLPSMRGKAGYAKQLSDKYAIDTNAYEKAVARVLSGEISALALSEETPGIKAGTLAKKVRQARIRAGLPVQANKGHNRPKPTESPQLNPKPKQIPEESAIKYLKRVHVHNL